MRGVPNRYIVHAALALRTLRATARCTYNRPHHAPCGYRRDRHHRRDRADHRGEGRRGSERDRRGRVHTHPLGGRRRRRLAERPGNAGADYGHDGRGRPLQDGPGVVARHWLEGPRGQPERRCGHGLRAKGLRRKPRARPRPRRGGGYRAVRGDAGRVRRLRGRDRGRRHRELPYPVRHRRDGRRRVHHRWTGAGPQRRRRRRPGSGYGYARRLCGRTPAAAGRRRGP